MWRLEMKIIFFGENGSWMMGRWRIGGMEKILESVELDQL